MSPVRALVAAPEGVAQESSIAWWAAERLGLVEAVRYLADGKVAWRRTAVGERWAARQPVITADESWVPS